MYLSILVKGGQEKSSGSSLKLGAKNPKSAEDEWGGDFGNEFVSTEDSGLPMAGEYNWDTTGETDQSDFFSSAMGLPKVRVCFVDHEILYAVHFFSNAGERITTFCTENLFCCEKVDYKGNFFFKIYMEIVKFCSRKGISFSSFNRKVFNKFSSKKLLTREILLNK